MSEVLFKILLVSEDLGDEVIITDELHAAGFNVYLRRVMREVEISMALDAENYDLVLIDHMLIIFSALQVVELLKQRKIETPYLVLYGSVTDITAVELLERSGIHQYVTKSHIQTLGGAIQREIEQAGARMAHRLEIEETTLALIAAFGRAAALKDRGTEDHTLRVTELALRLAREVGITKQALVNVQRGSLLHDIGKLGIPDSILLNAGPLTDEQWIIMKTHPQLAYTLLYPIKALRGALAIPFSHHCKWDGSGYPGKLGGDLIPLEARIFSVVDVYDALTNNRPYRDAWGKQRTLEHIASESGFSFDPEIVKIFMKMMEAGR